ncbi:molybdenum ABC transporter permease [Gelidibacter sp. F2691]|nr:molybdenum ABC transporter permease [Gelidibacter sp. F2691]
MDTPTLVIGIIALVLAIGLIYWISRRKFYRRNAMGAEGFSSFEASVFVRFLEGIGKWLAYALIIFGLLSIWTSSRIEKNKLQEKQKIEQPT